eukprot:scaffold11103_cov117-Cylindrotheca_fusiformis.AAC.3
MNHHERNKGQRTGIEGVDPKCSVCASETNYADIPTGSMTHVWADSAHLAKEYSSCVAPVCFLLSYDPEGLQVIEEDLFAIGGGAFSGYQSLTSSFDLPHGILHIGATLYLQLRRRHSQAVPDSSKSGCTGLKQIRLPPGLDRINELLVSGCERLEYYAEIPETVKITENLAFCDYAHP